MIPVPAVWNFNLSACWRRDIWNASLECFIAQAICFTNLKYCDDGFNGDYNLYVGGSRVSLAFPGERLLHQNSDISGLSGAASLKGSLGAKSTCPQVSPAGGTSLRVAANEKLPQKQKCPVESMAPERLRSSVRQRRRNYILTGCYQHVFRSP